MAHRGLTGRALPAERRVDGSVDPLVEGTGTRLVRLPDIDMAQGALRGAQAQTALSGTDEAIPAQQREYVLQVRAAATAAEKLTVYARAVAAIQPRLAPIFIALRDAAAAGDADCAALWDEISARRARDLRELAADLRGTGELRDDLTDDRVADIVWSMNAAEYWDLLVRRRGWSAEEFGGWLADARARLLLDPSQLETSHSKLRPRASRRAET